MTLKKIYTCKKLVIGSVEMHLRHFDFGMIGPQTKGYDVVEALVQFEELLTVKSSSEVVSFQEILEDDYDRSIEFCEIIMKKITEFKCFKKKSVLG